MPAISLVVCVYKERDFLERLLQHADGCYDDLVVVHDGPEERRGAETAADAGGDGEVGWKSPEKLSLSVPDAPPLAIARDYATLPPSAFMPTGYRLVCGTPVAGSVHEVVKKYGGSFYEGPRCFQQEPHWPFAWSQAKHDWILRLDADEYPTPPLIDWLKAFEPAAHAVPGFLGIWPLWTGRKEIWAKRHATRLFLFHRSRIRLLGMVEQSPEPVSGEVERLPLTIAHRPARKSFGIFNLIARKQAFRWRTVIARSLLRNPSDLPRWNYDGDVWNGFWKDLREHPLRIGLKRGIWSTAMQAVGETKQGAEFAPDAYAGTGLHQLLMATTLWRQKKRSTSGRKP